MTIAGNRASLVGWEHVDRVGCYGRQCADAFASLGHDAARLVLTGSLTLDRALARSKDGARSDHPVYRKFREKTPRLILFATSGINPNEPAILSAILVACADPDHAASLVVRPHPSLGANAYAASITARLAERAAIVTDGSVIDAIAAADVVITDYSTVGAEAVLMGRPLLVVNMTAAPFPANDYAALGVAAAATSLRDIGPQLARLLGEGCYWPGAQAARAAFQDAYNWGGDGQACARFLDAAAGLATARKPTGLTTGPTTGP